MFFFFLSSLLFVAIIYKLPLKTDTDDEGHKPVILVAVTKKLKMSRKMKARRILESL